MERKASDTKKATITRLRTGCWTCRRRGYRCDEAKPTCKTCSRLNIPCEGYGVRLKWKDSTPRPRNRKCSRQTETTAALSLGTTRQRNPDPPFPLLPGQYSDTDIFLLQHYFYTVSSLLSSTPNRTINTYLSTVLPLMLQHDFLLKTVLALSAVHLSSRFPDTFALHADKLKGDGIRGLIRQMGNDSTGQVNEQWDESVLATIIMLGILEVFEANACLWSRHLEGAASFMAAYLEKAGLSKETPHATSTSRKLLEIYAYHEVLASISLGRVPRLPSTFMRRPSTDDATVITDMTWSAYATRPEKRSVFLSAVDTLLSLVAELATIRSSTDPYNESSRRIASRIAESLRQWQCPDTQYSIETRNTAEAMRQAGILFYHLSWTDGAASGEAEGAVERIVQCLKGIPVQHSAVASHVWPLYMAGLAATCQKDKTFIRQRLDEMISVRGIRSIVQVKDTLVDIWDSHGTAKTALSFHNTGTGLVLF